MKKGTIKDPQNITRDVSVIGHWGNGDYSVIVENDDDIDNIMPLIKQSLKVNKKQKLQLIKNLLDDRKMCIKIKI